MAGHEDLEMKELQKRAASALSKITHAITRLNHEIDMFLIALRELEEDLYGK